MTHNTALNDGSDALLSMQRALKLDEEARAAMNSLDVQRDGADDKAEDSAVRLCDASKRDRHDTNRTSVATGYDTPSLAVLAHNVQSSSAPYFYPTFATTSASAYHALNGESKFETELTANQLRGTQQRRVQMQEMAKQRRLTR